MKQQAKLAVLFVCTLLLSGCPESADSFFSGCPSAMAMARNSVLNGSLNSTVELMRIPKRFPATEASRISSWQETAIAWWRAAGGRERFVSALSQVTPQEIDKPGTWIAHPAKAATLEEIVQTIRSRGTPRRDTRSL